MTWLCWLAGDSLERFCKLPVKSIPVHPASSFNFLRPISSRHLPFREVFIAEETRQRVHNTVLVGERQILYLVCSQPFTCLQKGCPGIWHQRLWRALSSSKEKPGASLLSNFYLHINEDALHWNQNNVSDMKHVRLRIREEKQQFVGWVPGKFYARRSKELSWQANNLVVQSAHALFSERT